MSLAWDFPDEEKADPASANRKTSEDQGKEKSSLQNAKTSEDQGKEKSSLQNASDDSRSAQKKQKSPDGVKLFIGLGFYQEVTREALLARIQEIVPHTSVLSFDMAKNQGSAFLVVSEKKFANLLVKDLHHTYIRNTKLNVQLDKRGERPSKSGGEDDTSRLATERDSWRNQGGGRGGQSFDKYGGGPRRGGAGNFVEGRGRGRGGPSRGRGRGGESNFRGRGGGGEYGRSKRGRED